MARRGVCLGFTERERGKGWWGVDGVVFGDGGWVGSAP